MHEHCGGSSAPVPAGVPRLALVGNPNVGKSVVFGLLTGRYATVSNYPGTTVEVTQGTISWSDCTTALVDTPGTNSLAPASEDEAVTLDILLGGVNGVVQVVDAKNLVRGLLMTSQLAEMGLPLVLVANMMDEARARGVRVDMAALRETLGVPVVGMVATRKEGSAELWQSLSQSRPARLAVAFDARIEQAAAEIADLLPEAPVRKQGLALLVLAGADGLSQWLKAQLPQATRERIQSIRDRVQAAYDEPLAYVMTQQRLRAVREIVDRTFRVPEQAPHSRLEVLGRLTMHPIWGVPVVLAVLAMIYYFVGIFGAGVLVDLLETTVFGGLINPAITHLVSRLPVPLVGEFLVGPYGLVTMALTYGLAIVLPIVGTFFIAFGLLEDSGYLPRLAVMTNQLFKAMGLNGKAVLPMILGLGCDTMATLTARIMDSRKERIIVTLLLALGVPCSAQLGVILGMLGGLPPAAVLIWGGVVGGVMVAVGFLASKVLPGEESEFVLELPPLRVPQLSNLLIKTIARIEWYLREALPLFVVATVFLFVTDKVGALTWLERTLSPVIVGWLGLPAKATEAYIVGFLRRDYGAAGLFALARQGLLSPRQVVVSLVTMTLFVPCIANMLVIVKERGWRTGAAIVSFVLVLAVVVGGALNQVLGWLSLGLS